MTLIIELPPNQEATLNAKDRAQGISVEDYACQVLADELEGATDSAPFWKAFTRRMDSLPDDVFEHFPTDGASEHDQYLYGSTKEGSHALFRS